MSLWTIALQHTGWPLDKWQHYIPIYERHLSRYANTPVLVLEIGCGAGGSLQVWRKYFGPHARVAGVDNRPQCKAFEQQGIAVRIGDQSDPRFWSRFLAEFGAPDIVIDDGSHQMSDVTASFRCLYPALDKRGVYIVEDMHTAYWPEFGGGLRRDGTFIELSKALIDELNANHSRGELEPTPFTNETLSICFYDSMVVFEKGSPLSKERLTLGVTGQARP